MSNLSKSAFIAVLLVIFLVSSQNGTTAAPDHQAATAPGTSAATQPARATAAATRAVRATEAPTIQPTQNAIAETGYELLFPMMVRYWTAVRLPVDKIASVRLKIYQMGVIDQDISVPVKETTRPLSGEAAIIMFAWPLTEKNAPEPFTSITYSWTVTSADKTVYQSGTNAFIYTDPSKVWMTDDTKPLQFYWSNANLNIGFIRENLLRSREMISRNTGYQGEYKFIIYDAGSELCQNDQRHPGQKVVLGPKDETVYACDPGNAAKVYAARGFTMIQRSSPLIEQLQDDLIAIMANDAYSVMFKSSTEQLPEWFRKGLLQMYNLVGRSNALLLARDAARTDRLLTLNELNTSAVTKPNDFGASVRNWNGQAYMLTLYLSARFGAQTPFQIAKDVAAGTKFADALAKLGSNVTIERLYNDWKTWLLSPDADQAVRWNPYNLTPTATLTPTETLYPTLTPYTPAPISTDTPIPSNTARPSPTITPSNTPRPPGSLPTPTISAT